MMSISNGYYGSSSAESEPVPPERRWEWRGPNHVRVLLLDANCTSLLMLNSDSGWDLPLFKYKAGIEEGIRSRAVCRDFSKWYGHDIQFIFVVELLGNLPFHNGDFENDEAGRLADLKLVLVEQARVEDSQPMVLPGGTSWKDAQFISALLREMMPDDERMKPFEKALKCVERGSTLLSSLPEPRHRLGWFDKASTYLESLIIADGAEVEGPVLQLHASFTSTVLIASSSERRYFLKAPARGSRETEITEIISSQMSRYTPPLVGVSLELGSFVTKEVVIGKSCSKAAFDTLGRIQLDSLSFIDKLKEVGCPVRDIDSIRDQLKFWAEDYETERVSSISLWIGETACYLMYLCRRIGELGIPLTLVHGDFSPCNVAHRFDEPEEIVMFDWEFACISHPFFDFFLYRRNSHVLELDEESITSYLTLWKDYGDMDTLREAFTIGTIVGHVLRIWSLWDRAEMCEHQDESALENWMTRETNVLDDSLRERMATDEGYAESPEAKLESEMDIMRW